MKTRSSYPLLLVFLAQLAWSQAPLFRSKPVEKLGTARASAVFQDRYGWMWFGCDGGLFRFDGLEFQPVALPDSLASEQVTALYETADRLWVGFQSGAIGFLPADRAILSASPSQIKNEESAPARLMEQWMPEEGTPRRRINGFCPDTSGGLWIATYGEGLYCWKNNRLYQFGEDDGLTSSDIYAIACDGRGRIWAATDAGISICAMPAPGVKQVEKLTTSDGLPDEIVSTLLADRQGNIWIGMYDKGVCLFDIRRNEFEYVSPNWSYGQVTSLMMFGSREIWVGTAQSGLIRLELPLNGQGACQVYQMPENHPLRRKKIETMCKDREGLLWVLSSEGEIYSALVRVGLLTTPGGDVQAVYLDRQNRLWAGTSRGLYLRKNDHFETILPEQNILSLWEAPDGNLWVGTFGNGVFVLDSNGAIRYRLQEGHGLTNGSVLSISGNTDRVWLATLGGVTEMKWKDFSLHTYISELGTGYVYTVLADSKGRIWFGTDGEGLVVLQNGTFTHYNQAAGEFLKRIYSIIEDNLGNIWFSNDKGSLFCFNGHAFQKYTARDNLHHSSINGLAVDGNGYIIVAYEEGIDVLTPGTGHVAHLDAANGAPSTETNFNALCRDDAGNVWIGTKQGVLRLAAFDESFVYDPEPNITAVSVLLQPLDFLANNTFKYYKNYFLFNFTGLWYTNPDAVRYRYRLEGFDPNWVVSKEHFASYPNLPPGHYVFHLQATEHGAFEGTPEATYAFTIKPPFWTRWWFILLCMAGAAGLLYTFIHIREARFLREAALRRESVESQFAALKSQINPHFLFNSFNTLITTIEENPKTAVEYVEHLSDFYRSMMVYREKDLISLQEEMELVLNFDFLLKKRYEENFHLHTRLNGQSGYIMPLTLQMLVENAVKHNIISRAKPLHVDIYVENNRHVVVRNNIQHKLKPEPGTHFGLHSLINRYALMGADPVIVEETDAFFTVKVPIL